tara:strand:- start:809 stop:1270 length:462 start_codon:yes stop_codon:yes gene_type:complete
MSFIPAPRSKSAINSQYKKGPLVDCLMMYQLEVDRLKEECALASTHRDQDSKIINNQYQQIKELKRVLATKKERILDLESMEKSQGTAIRLLSIKTKKLESEATLKNQLVKTAKNIDAYIRVELPRLAEDIDTGIKATLKTVDQVRKFNWTIQ